GWRNSRPVGGRRRAATAAATGRQLGHDGTDGVRETSASPAPSTIPGVTAMGETVHGSGGSGSLVLVLNSGSSSVKFAVLAPAGGERVLAGMAGEGGAPPAGAPIPRASGPAAPPTPPR